MIQFSVIIPVYNKASHIGETLQSVLNQTYQNFEVIVVNDGSTDDSLREIKKYNDERLQVFTTLNKGVSTARNFGAQHANGAYFIFLDADDFWEINHLEMLNRLINDFPDAVLYCSGYKRQVNASTYQRAQFGGLNDKYRGVVNDYFEHSLPFSIAGMGTAAVPQEHFNNAGGFPLNVSHGEDIVLWVKLALKGKVVLDNQPTAIHNLAAENRLSNLKLENKTFADFSMFKEEEANNKALKKYLDNNRYSIALSYRLSGDKERFKIWMSQVNLANLNAKQRMLLHLPQSLVLALKYVHQFLAHYGLYISSFR